MNVLGISAYYHDSAAALLRHGEIVVAAQEERFTRIKHDASFPAQAIRQCLARAGLTGREIDFVAFYDKPFLKFERLLETYLAFAPAGFTSFRKAMPVWISEKLFQKDLLRRQLRSIDEHLAAPEKLLFCEHHFSHAASAFYPSPFEQAAVLTLDGVGEWATTSAGVGSDRELVLTKEIHFPHSLGLLYSAFTFYTGFKVNSGEYKLMGLAPYGEPKHVQTILDHLIDLKPDGSFRLDLQYFGYCTGLTMTNEAFHRLFGGLPRAPDEPLTQHHMDLAASIQSVTEEAVLRLTRALAAESGMRNLCLAGGVALNCVANGKVLRDKQFASVFVQPAAGDAGGAVGAALAAFHMHARQPRRVNNQLDGMAGAYLGPAFEDADCARRLRTVGARFKVLDEPTVIDRAVADLAAGKALGWFQGRMEFGPRALGNRSIIADPRSPTMQSVLNLKVKYRKLFRPFAPAVLHQDASDWFELDVASPYMLLVANVAAHRRRDPGIGDEALFGIDKLQRPRSDIPAVTHVDYSARIQTVHQETNPRFFALLTAFKAPYRLSGVGEHQLQRSR